jgi:hypothetical protein
MKLAGWSTPASIAANGELACYHRWLQAEVRMTTIGAGLFTSCRAGSRTMTGRPLPYCAQQGGLVVNKMRSQGNPWMQRR